MENEKKETEKEVNNALPAEESATEVTNLADYYTANPNINKKNAITIVVPSRAKFIDIYSIVDEAKKHDPKFNVGKLFLTSLDFAQTKFSEASSLLGDLSEAEMLEVKQIVEEAKKDDPTFTVSKLFKDALAYCQSQGFYIVNTHNNGSN